MKRKEELPFEDNEMKKKRLIGEAPPVAQEQPPVAAPPADNPADGVDQPAPEITPEADANPEIDQILIKLQELEQRLMKLETPIHEEAVKDDDEDEEEKKDMKESKGMADAATKQPNFDNPEKIPQTAQPANGTAMPTKEVPNTNQPAVGTPMAGKDIPKAQKGKEAAEDDTLADKEKDKKKIDGSKIMGEKTGITEVYNSVREELTKRQSITNSFAVSDSSVSEKIDAGKEFLRKMGINPKKGI